MRPTLNEMFLKVVFHYNTNTPHLCLHTCVLSDFREDVIDNAIWKLI